MFLIIGLGNPGKKYQKNRHNIGFMILDQLARQHKTKINKVKYKSLYGKGLIGKEKVIFAKPHTYMNLSGEAVVQFLKWHRISPENMIVIYDDMDLPLGKIRLRPNGRAGGHNGLKSIIDTIKTLDFPRLRIGIGKPTNKIPAEKYVLTNFKKVEAETIGDAIINACRVIDLALNKNLEKAMNEFN